MHNMPNKNIIGSRLAEVCKAGKGITPLDLADKVTSMGVKIDRTGIAKIETGIRHVLDYEVVALSKVLGVEVGLKSSGFLPTIEGMTRFRPEIY